MESLVITLERIKKPTKSQAKFSWIERLKPTKNLLQLSYYLLLPVTSVIHIHPLSPFVKQNLRKIAGKVSNRPREGLTETRFGLHRDTELSGHSSPSLIVPLSSGAARTHLLRTSTIGLSALSAFSSGWLRSQLFHQPTNSKCSELEIKQRNSCGNRALFTSLSTRLMVFP